MWTLAGHTRAVCALAVLPGGLLASGSGDKTMRLWEVGGGRLVPTLTGHTGVVMALAGLPGVLLASGSEDETVVVWRGTDCVGNIKIFVHVTNHNEKHWPRNATHKQAA